MRRYAKAWSWGFYTLFKIHKYDSATFTEKAVYKYYRENGTVEQPVDKRAVVVDEMENIIALWDIAVNYDQRFMTSDRVLLSGVSTWMVWLLLTAEMKVDFMWVNSHKIAQLWLSFTKRLLS